MKSELDKDIEKLIADSKNISDKACTSNQIKDLPIPVQRYFKYSLKEYRPYVSYVRLQHGGEFKASKNWVSIKGEEYFTVKKPGRIYHEFDKTISDYVFRYPDILNLVGALDSFSHFLTG